MFTCNGQSPCPVLYAEEGDIVELTLKSDIYAQSSIHLYVDFHTRKLRVYTKFSIFYKVWHRTQAVMDPQSQRWCLN